MPKTKKDKKEQDEELSGGENESETKVINVSKKDASFIGHQKTVITGLN